MLICYPVYNSGVKIHPFPRGQIYLAEIDLDQLRDYRAHEVMGNRYRHPDAYRILAERI